MKRTYRHVPRLTAASAVPRVNVRPSPAETVPPVAVPSHRQPPHPQPAPGVRCASAPRSRPREADLSQPCGACLLPGHRHRRLRLRALRHYCARRSPASRRCDLRTHHRPALLLGVPVSACALLFLVLACHHQPRSRLHPSLRMFTTPSRASVHIRVQHRLLHSADISTNLLLHAALLRAVLLLPPPANAPSLHPHRGTGLHRVATARATPLPAHYSPPPIPTHPPTTHPPPTQLSPLPSPPPNHSHQYLPPLQQAPLSTKPSRFPPPHLRPPLTPPPTTCTRASRRWRRRRPRGRTAPGRPGPRPGRRA